MAENVVEIVIRANEQFEKSFKGAVDGMDGIVKAASTMSAVLIGASVAAAASIAVLTEKAIINAAEMGKMAQIAGMSVEEFSKLAKRITEDARIEVRGRRDDVLKKIKAAQDRKELTEDTVFKGKERVQKAVDAANGKIETALNTKLGELSE